MEISSAFSPLFQPNFLLSEQTDNDYLQAFKDEASLLFGIEDVSHCSERRDSPLAGEVFSPFFDEDKAEVLETEDEDKVEVLENEIDRFENSSYFYDIDNEEESSTEIIALENTTLKKRKVLKESSKPYSHLDNLFYETLKIGYNRLNHPKKGDFFLKIT